MATFIRSKNICITVDPGFDATEVVVNGQLFNIPNAILDITGKTREFLELGNGRRTKGYLVSHYISNKEYLVGELARKSLNEKAEREEFMAKHDMMDSKNRFETTDFEVNLMTCIGVAIVRYAKESVARHLKPEIDITNPNDVEGCRFYIGVALPNDWVDDVGPTVKKYIIGEHEYTVDMEDGSYKLRFSVGNNNVFCTSQAVCALIGTAYNDAGKLIPGCSTLQNLPAIIIDGGYRTMGIFQLTTANRVSAAESNTDFAMGNVYKEVAEILKNKYGRRNIHDFMIPEIIASGGAVNYLTHSKENEDETISSTVDVNKIVAEVRENVCSELISYLDAKYDNFLETKQIIVTGGTGAAYYEQINEYLTKHRSHLAGHVILTDYEFLGSSIDPVYGVVVGLYKITKNLFTKMMEKVGLEDNEIMEIPEEKAKSTPKAVVKQPKKEPQPKKENPMDKLKNKPSNDVVDISEE